MGKLFGTDGIRGVANEYPMTPDMALKVGRVVGLHFGGTKGSSVLIGRDTRISGQMIESALVAGCCCVGVDVLRTGVMPTPGVAYLTNLKAASAGIVVSASHNPYYDNGIKLFDSNGFKLSENTEAILERQILDSGDIFASGKNSKIGRVVGLTDHEEQYISHLTGSLPKKCRFSDFKVLLDCANGASHRVAPVLFTDLGASVEALFDDPDGQNINDGCGSQHPHILADRLKNTEADVGFAFDGDGDRLIAVDDTGQILTGDQILAICAWYLKGRGRLKNNIVVSTVMSNMGLGEALKEMGVENIVTGVGDRYVMEEMRKRGAILGGEESGHTVFLNHQTTGDGMLTALKLLEIMETENKPLSDLKKIMTVFPQVLINVNVKSKPSLETIPEVKAAIRQVETELTGKGRVLVRYSGTQPQCRVMVESLNAEDTNYFCDKIAKVVKEVIGS